MALSICGSFLLWSFIGVFLAHLWEIGETRMIVWYTSLPPSGAIRDEGPVDTEVISMVMWADLD